MACGSGRQKVRRPCIGDMKETIVLQTRAITPINSESVDFSEDFATSFTVQASTRTVRGKEIFDGTNIVGSITHEFTIRYNALITQEYWVLFNSERFNILDVEDLDERHRFMVLRCTDRGTNANQSNFA